VQTWHFKTIQDSQCQQTAILQRLNPQHYLEPEQKLPAIFLPDRTAFKQPRLLGILPLHQGQIPVRKNENAESLQMAPHGARDQNTRTVVSVT
jgi:hypothetical protein